MFYRYKRFNAILNSLSLLVTSLGVVIGPVLHNVLVTAILAAVGMFLKGWNDFKDYALKMDMSKFAYATHAKALAELRNTTTYSDNFLLRQLILQDVIIDFAPPIPDHILRRYASTQEEVDGKKLYKDPSPNSDIPQSCREENNTEAS